jgi:hypothetical protein
MFKLASKGYTLHITSWENDGDDYKTKTYTVDTLEEAKNISHLCHNLFKSQNSSEGHIGNSVSDRRGEMEDVAESIISYMEENPHFLPELDREDHEGLVQHILDINTKLLGNSEFYICRVFHKLTITYSPEDIFVQEINLQEIK